MLAAYLPDVIRVVTVVCLAFVCLMLPVALDMHSRARRSQALVAGVVCFVLAGVRVVMQHWGEPLQWDRSPVLLLGAVLLTGYCVAALRSQKKQRK